MYNNILEIGTKIDLYYVSASGNADSKKHYVSQLLELGAGNRANIAMPMEGGRIIPVSVGEVYDLLFYTKNGLYKCRSKVVDRYRIRNLFIAVIEFEGELKKYQRRQLFRLECLLDITYHKMTNEEMEVRNQIQNIDVNTPELTVNALKDKLSKFPKDINKAVAIDISGGGIKMRSSEELEKGSYVLLQIPMFTDGIIRNMTISAKIINSGRSQGNSLVYEHRAGFVNLSEADKEFIIRYIFKEERNRRKREKG